MNVNICHPNGMLEGKVGGMERQPPEDCTLPLEGLYLKYFGCIECHLDVFCLQVTVLI